MSSPHQSPNAEPETVSGPDSFASETAPVSAGNMLHNPEVSIGVPPSPENSSQPPEPLLGLVPVPPSREYSSQPSEPLREPVPVPPSIEDSSPPPEHLREPVLVPPSPEDNSPPTEPLREPVPVPPSPGNSSPPPEPLREPVPVPPSPEDSSPPPEPLREPVPVPPSPENSSPPPEPLREPVPVPPSPEDSSPPPEPLREPVPEVRLEERAAAISDTPQHVCQEDGYDPEAVAEFVRIVNESLPRIGPELVTPTLDRVQAQELIESIKCKPNDDPGPSTVIAKPIPEEDIFSKPTDYGEEFLLTENMVNSYTFSDESKSTDCSGDDSPMDDNDPRDKTTDNVVNDDNQTDVEMDEAIPSSLEPNVAADSAGSNAADNMLVDEISTSDAMKANETENANQNMNSSDDVLKEIDDALAKDPKVTVKMSESVHDLISLPKENCSETDKSELQDVKPTPVEAIENNIPPAKNADFETGKGDPKIIADLSDKTLEDKTEAMDVIDDNITPVSQVVSVDTKSKEESNIAKKLPVQKILDEHTELPNISKTFEADEALAGPSETEKQKMDLDSSDEVPVPEDTLGLFAEARTLLRDDDEEEDAEDDDVDDEDDDVNNDDDESNQMAPDSSEVESNAPTNDIQDPAEIDQSDGDQTNQSEQETDQGEEEVDRSLSMIARSCMDIDEGVVQFEFTVTSLAGEGVDAVCSESKLDTQSGKNVEETDTIAEEKETLEDTSSVQNSVAVGLVSEAIKVTDTSKEIKAAKVTETVKPIDTAKEPESATVTESVKVMDGIKTTTVTEVKTTKAVESTEAIKSTAEDNKTTEQSKTEDNEVTATSSENVEDIARESENKQVELATTIEDEGQKTPSELVTSKPSQETAEQKRADTPSKSKKLEIGKPGNVMNIVDLGSSSDSDDVQETGKMRPPETPVKVAAAPETTATVNIPGEVDVMSAGGAGGAGGSRIVSTPEENVISGIPAATPPKKVAPRINTSEITIKTAPKIPDPPTITIPDEVDDKAERPKKKAKVNLEVFNVDSDEDDEKAGKRLKKLSAIDLEKARDTRQCINYLCGSGGGAEYFPAPSFVLSYFEVKRSRRCAPLVCAPCFERVARRSASLMEGVRGSEPLLSLDMDKECQEFVEISDSDSDSESEETPASFGETLSPATARLLEESLAVVLNETWVKFGLGERLKTCEEELQRQLTNLEKDSEEIDSMLAESQKTMDQLRNDLYSTFASEVRELDPIDIDDGSVRPLSQPPPTPTETDTSDIESRRSKRQRRVVNYEETSVRSPIPLGYAHLGSPAPAQPPLTPATTPRDTDSPVIVDVKLASKPADDNADVSVVELSTEKAPEGLPPPGPLERPVPRAGAFVYAVRQSVMGSWVPARVTEVWGAGSANAGGSGSQFTMAKVRFDHKLKGPTSRQLSGRQMAYFEPSAVRLAIGTRVIALFKAQTDSAKRDSYYSGIIAEPPTPVNSYRYMVFFDDGYTQYVSHGSMRVVCEESARVWDDVHPDSREFVRQYLLAYPERPMVRLQSGQALKTEWNGKWWVSRVVAVDASLVQVLFEADGRVEWIYRGSTRLAPLYLELQASQRHRPRGLTRLNKQAPVKANMPYVEYTRSDEQEVARQEPAQPGPTPREESRRTQYQQQRAVAKKSTAAPVAAAPSRAAAPQPVDNLMTRVVYYSPKAAVRPLRMVPHDCSPHCRRTDVLPLRELKTYNPLTRPLLTGWERHINRYKGKKVVTYRSPCGRIVRDMPELHRYLRAVRSEMSVDLFDFNHITHCLAEFVLNKCYVSKKDLSHGKENVPIPCVNYYDGSLPEFCLYNTERTPTAGVPLNLDPDFLCGCDCTDDCQDKSKCACWKLTLEGAKTIGLDGADVGYHYKRLPEPLPSGIYECNSRCKCAQTCLNRVAQHPLQLKLQVFKTLNRGWGIRALNDVPKGAFLCVYAGNLLTDATANLDGVNEGDEYLAELDYIEVVERMKEGYESDVQDDSRKAKGSEGDTEEESEEERDSAEELRRRSDADLDFRPDYVGPNLKFTKSLRKRKEVKQDKEKVPEKDGDGAVVPDDDQFITISDDEEVREPSRFTAQTGLDGDDYRPRHRSVRGFYGEDEACYIMDAKVQGNIGRYLNHSCLPNVFVQNVFVDTHDPRFPWVAFFALCHIQAGSELTWNYNYDVGSVPNKVMYCKCGAMNCRGRLL